MGPTGEPQQIDGSLRFITINCGREEKERNEFTLKDFNPKTYTWWMESWNIFNLQDSVSSPRQLESSHSLILIYFQF